MKQERMSRDLFGRPGREGTYPSIRRVSTTSIMRSLWPSQQRSLWPSLDTLESCGAFCIRSINRIW
jgi:hypothetical protein